jgi:hypothetical protein
MENVDYHAQYETRAALPLGIDTVDTDGLVSCNRIGQAVVKHERPGNFPRRSDCRLPLSRACLKVMQKRALIPIHSGNPSP